MMDNYILIFRAWGRGKCERKHSV